MKLVALHHVHFTVTDLDKTERFASDFGLKTASKTNSRLVMRTIGGDAFSYIADLAPARGFLGLGFSVESEADLEEAVSRHGATSIHTLDTPGGGKGVRLTDPEGLQVDLVAGIAETHLEPLHKPLALNIPSNRSRLNASQNFRPLEPARLFRLGHVGLYVKDLAAMSAWYERVLGLLISDTMYIGDPEKKVTVFFRLNRGEALVDHHSLFLAQADKTDCHHISFEAQDFEAQFTAHRWLKQRGWESNWGVGRHPLGSHIFDVWFDPDRYRFETFSDTDVLDASKPPGNYEATTQDMDLWSSDPPDRYFA